MGTGFRALYVVPGLNSSPVKEKQFPNQAVHFLTSAVSSSTDGRRNIATKIMMFIRVFCLGVQPHAPNFNVDCGFHFFFQFCLGAFCSTLKLGCGVFIASGDLWNCCNISSAYRKRWSSVLFSIFVKYDWFLSRPDAKTESGREKISFDDTLVLNFEIWK